MKRFLELVIIFGLLAIAMGLFISDNIALGYVVIGMQLLHLNQILNNENN